MAKSPQLENGLTPLANELIDAFCHVNLSAYESRILWFLLRKTYGYHKKTDRISYSQLEVGTGLKRWHINRTIERLVKRNIIIKNGEGYNLEYGIQKDYDLWKSLPNEVTNIVTQRGNGSLPKEVTNTEVKSLPQQVELLPIQVESLPKEVTKSLPKEVNTKERNIIQKKIQKIYKGNLEVEPLKQKFGEFNNVLLSPQEYEKLIAKFGKNEADDKIEYFSGAIASKGLKYLSHYATILNWSRRDGRADGKHQASHGTPKVYTEGPDYPEYHDA